MPRSGLALYVFGSSLTSAYWNGAATYYRGLYKNLHALGYHITFAEPDILHRQAHRDFDADPTYARCLVYRTRLELEARLREARAADLIIKHSGVGADDAWLEQAVLDAAAAAPAGARPRVAYWDVDAPATLSALEADRAAPLRRLLPTYDFVLTYGGGPGVVQRFRALGAKNCYPVYNGLDPDTHFPVAPAAPWRTELVFVGHRLPDREARVRRFFFDAARRLPQRRFLLCGEGWARAEALPGNIEVRGHVPTHAHNVVNASADWVLNLNRDCMAAAGYSPPTRMFEAAGAAAPVITDAWPGIELFFEPGREILVVRDGAELADCLHRLGREPAHALGRRMRERALADHTYARRAARVHRLLHHTAPASIPSPTLASPVAYAGS